MSGVVGENEFTSFGRLHIDSDCLFAGPCKSVGDEDRFAGLVRGVDLVCKGFERGIGDEFVGVEDFGVFALGVLVDDGDAGAGGEVVEAVEGDLFPVFSEFGVGVGLAVEPGEGG